MTTNDGNGNDSPPPATGGINPLLADLSPEQHAAVRAEINAAAAAARRNAMARAERPASPAPGGSSIDPTTIARRAAAFATAGYAPDEIEQYAADLSVAMPAPPPRSAISRAPAPAVPTGPSVTSRANPPPSSVPGDDVPILSMSIPERMALRQKIGDAAYAERNEREMRTRNVRVRVL